MYLELRRGRTVLKEYTKKMREKELSKETLSEEKIQELLERKMEGLLEERYHECLLIFDCVPDLLKCLKMIRDKDVVASATGYFDLSEFYRIDCKYHKMLGFLLQELGLIEIIRTYLSYLDEITEEGLEMLNYVDSPLYKKMVERPFK